MAKKRNPLPDLLHLTELHIVRNWIDHFNSFVVSFHDDGQGRESETVYNSDSCCGSRVPVCGFRVPVVCNASLFCVMHRRITQHVWGGMGGGCTTKKVAHYKKKVTHYKKTGTRNPKQEPLLLLSSEKVRCSVFTTLSGKSSLPTEFFRNYQQQKVDRSGNYVFPYFSYIKFVAVTCKFSGV